MGIPHHIYIERRKNEGHPWWKLRLSKGVQSLESWNRRGYSKKQQERISPLYDKTGNMVSPPERGGECFDLMTICSSASRRVYVGKRGSVALDCNTQLTGRRFARRIRGDRDTVPALASEPGEKGAAEIPKRDQQQPLKPWEELQIRREEQEMKGAEMRGIESNSSDINIQSMGNVEYSSSAENEEQRRGLGVGVPRSRGVSKEDSQEQIRGAWKRASVKAQEGKRFSSSGDGQEEWIEVLDEELEEGEEWYEDEDGEWFEVEVWEEDKAFAGEEKEGGEIKDEEKERGEAEEREKELESEVEESKVDGGESTPTKDQGDSYKEERTEEEKSRDEENVILGDEEGEGRQGSGDDDDEEEEFVENVDGVNIIITIPKSKQEKKSTFIDEQTLNENGKQLRKTTFGVKKLQAEKRENSNLNQRKLEATEQEGDLLQQLVQQQAQLQNQLQQHSRRSYDKHKLQLIKLQLQELQQQIQCQLEANEEIVDDSDSATVSELGYDMLGHVKSTQHIQEENQQETYVLVSAKEVMNQEDVKEIEVAEEKHEHELETVEREEKEEKNQDVARKEKEEIEEEKAKENRGEEGKGSEGEKESEQTFQSDNKTEEIEEEKIEVLKGNEEGEPDAGGNQEQQQISSEKGQSELRGGEETVENTKADTKIEKRVEEQDKEEEIEMYEEDKEAKGKAEKHEQQKEEAKEEEKPEQKETDSATNMEKKEEKEMPEDVNNEEIKKESQMPPQVEPQNNDINRLQELLRTR